MHSLQAKNVLRRDDSHSGSPRIAVASLHRLTLCKGEAAMITSSSRTFRNALTAYCSHIERRRSMARVRDLDDHMLRQFGLSRVQLVAM